MVEKGCEEMKKFFLLTAAAALGTLAGNDGVYRYDFGTAVSPLREGYIRVTHGKGKEFQWRTQTKLRSAANKIIDSQENKRRKSVEPPPVYYNELTCDHVTGSGEAELTLKVPAGPYIAWALCGHAGRPSREFVWNVQIGGQELNLWKKFGIREVIFPVKADSSGARINIKTKSSWLINGLILVPEKQWKSFKNSDEFKNLSQEIFMLPADKLKKWNKIPQPIIRPQLSAQWNTQQQKEGFALFRRGANDPVFPNELPKKEEINAPLRCFAAGSELESLTFTVHALKDLDKVSLSASDLTGPGKSKLKAPELRYIRYMYVRPHYTVTNQYFEAPDIVMPYRQAMSLEKGRNLRFWLTVKVPAGTKPGIYSGKVTLKCDRITKVLPLTVRVLGFELLRDPQKIYSIYYNVPMPENVKNSPHTKAWVNNKRETELAGLQEAGFTGVTMGFWATRRQGKDLFILTENFRNGAKALAKYGITAPVPASYGEGRLYADNMKKSLPPHLSGMTMPNEAYFKDVEATIKKIFAEYKKNPQWPEPLIYLTDEPDCMPTVVAYLKRLGEIVKRNGGRTYVTADPANKLFAPLFDVVDVWCPSQFTLTPEQMKAWKKKRPGTEFWCYPNSVCGSNNHVTPAGARMTFGYGFWKSEFKALIPWMYQSIGGDQWNYLDAPRMDFLNRTDNDGSPIPAMNFLCYREGIDDARYIYTLQTRIAKARKAGALKAAAEGQKVIDDLSSAIPAQRRYKDHADGVWDTGTMDAWRWKLASAIMKIDAVLNSKGARK